MKKDYKLIKQLGILLMLLFVYSSNIQAKKVEGYVINEFNDTIRGKVKLWRLNVLTGQFILSRDLDDLHTRLRFKSNNERHFQVFYPDDEILGFGFIYKNKKYEFRKFAVSQKSLVRNEKKRNCFLKILHDGNIVLYKDVYIFVNEAYTSQDDRIGKNITYYLSKKGDNQLIPLKLNSSSKNIRGILEEVDVEDEFIQTLPDDLNFKEINIILEKYDEWKKQHFFITSHSTTEIGDSIAQE